MRKNDVIMLVISDVTNEGMGVGKIDGMAVFVPFSAPGDVISVRILKVAKSYAYAKIERVILPSEDRIAPNCQSFGRCGGCDFRHMSYDRELMAKEKFVHDAFLRIGGFDLKDVSCEKILFTGVTDGYRNKAQLPVAGACGEAYAGFFSERSHRVIPAEDCRMHPEIFNQIIKYILGYHNENRLSCYDETSGKGLLRHIYLRRGYHSGEISVCLVVSKNTGAYAELAEKLPKEFPDIATVVLNINPARTNVILGEKTAVLYGNGTVEDEICGVKVELSPKSFYQVNTAAAELVYKKAAEYACLTGGETVLDLYCGAGTIGLSMAKNAGKIVGVEIVEDAVKNARENARKNGVNNAEFYAGDAGDIAQRLERSGIRPDVILLDPPRKGCDRATLDAVMRMAPERVVMISCNPATAARDVKIMAEKYRLQALCPADMFPRTRHVECVIGMFRK